MTKHIELKKFNQATALATGTLALPALVIEELEEFKGSSTVFACRLGLRPKRCLPLMRNSFVASATNVTLTGKAIAGVRSTVRSVGMAARLPFGGRACVRAVVPNIRVDSLAWHAGHRGDLRPSEVIALEGA
jgi:hypothetical protein